MSRKNMRRIKDLLAGMRLRAAAAARRHTPVALWMISTVQTARKARCA
jgi:hypothetical protein